MRKVLAKKKSNKRSEFILMVLHELKTPISSINGYASLLMTNELGATNERQNEILTKIVERCDYLGEMISKLLQLSKPLPASSMKRVKINLNDIILKNVNIINILAEEKGLSIDQHLPKETIYINAMEGDFTQLLTNLLSNAVKFNRQGGKIDVSLKKDGKNILLSVSDTGVGIPKKDMSKIFEKFYHQDVVYTKANQSTGLGLSIARKIVKNYHGTIECKSKQGVGTTFIIKIPAQ